MRKNIVIIGSSNTDMIIKMSHLPRPGETVLSGEFSTAGGGKGANQAVSAARAGGQVVFIARVGEDMFGEQAVREFIEDRIHVDYIFRDKDAPSGVALIFVDEQGENVIAVASGANAHLSPADIEASKDIIASARIVLLQLEIPIETVKTAIEIAMINGVDIILNPAPARPLGIDILKHVSILTPNETEAELLTGIKVGDENGAARAAHELSAKGVKTVVLTLGSRGVYVFSEDFTGIIPGFSVDTVDTTAAGDVFNGVLAVSLAENKSLFDAVRFSNAAAALSVTKLGAQTSAPYRSEIELLLKIKA
ncbi:MAG TPA: ribokinase [Anaerolineae bacterium]|nr:ribokinase [Anaerolineae bacterium]